METWLIVWIAVSVVTFLVIAWQDFHFIVTGWYSPVDWCWSAGWVVLAPVMWVFFAVLWCLQQLIFAIQARKRKRGDFK